mgnify:CR=1 FL=1
MPTAELGRLDGGTAGALSARRRVALLAAASVVALAGAGTGAIVATEPPGGLASSVSVYQEPPATITAHTRAVASCDAAGVRPTRSIPGI